MSHVSTKIPRVQSEIKVKDQYVENDIRIVELDTDYDFLEGLFINLACFIRSDKVKKLRADIFKLNVNGCLLSFKEGIRAYELLNMYDNRYETREGTTIGNIHGKHNRRK
ncbi:hypothetical protein [Bacillus toyonensis]|uniref:hypothetical protein n=1 Tax=Bacillus toyonensis TaxID=155322 RepID=UPI000BF9BCC5|nr:hypothetical protein [Bacillus toyonensis]PGF05133.1 hypothetical protein COM61_01540 [Bacillus toyonensis]